MEKNKRSLSVSLKLFTGAFPERVSLTLVPGARVRDLMAQVQKENLKKGGREDSPIPLQQAAQDDLLLILNGRPIQNLQGYDTLLEDGDILAVFPVMAGG